MTVARSLERILEFSAPDGWRRIDLPNGMAFAPAHDLDAVQGRIEFAPVSFSVQKVPAIEGSFEQAIEHLMRRRVPDGEPGRFRAEVDGLPAYGFDWTDGIANIRSLFVRSPDGHFLEVNVGRSAFSIEDRPAFGDFARDLLTRLRWRD
ncbi:MAG: hypothetical protein QM820_45065 [Minicystis sp.]